MALTAHIGKGEKVRKLKRKKLKTLYNVSVI